MSESRAWFRWAAVAMIVGGAVMFLLQAGELFASNRTAYFAAVGPAIGVAQLLIAFGCVGLWSDHAFGGGVLARTGLALAIVGLALLAIGNIFEPFADLALFFASATVAIPIGFVLAGIAALRSRTWHGWERFVPLGVGVLPFVILPVYAAGSAAGEFAVGVWGLAFVLLGWAELREPPLQPIGVSGRPRDRRSR
ncbi:hypothetical protein SPF06_07580 [Sinomonas sp. JGH33]|uniref:Uncharacterized protein n=1 Tax=Sinomonas terricola TaxID=3110330 RepID=A0ABU5T4I8_9MICC|nr:hypothetical protein [Sinomonas sp. JGH33]MEA5454579.1 hypothetical protein [Sinomonas sp. JGH33]